MRLAICVRGCQTTKKASGCLWGLGTKIDTNPIFGPRLLLRNSTYLHQARSVSTANLGQHQWVAGSQCVCLQKIVLLRRDVEGQMGVPHDAAPALVALSRTVRLVAAREAVATLDRHTPPQCACVPES